MMFINFFLKTTHVRQILAKTAAHVFHLIRLTLYAVVRRLVLEAYVKRVPRKVLLL